MTLMFVWAALLDLLADSVFRLGTLLPAAVRPPGSSCVRTVPFLLTWGLFMLIKSRLA